MIRRVLFLWEKFSRAGANPQGIVQLSNVS
jgi:hypothetical protein